MPIDPRTGQAISEEEYRRLLLAPVDLSGQPTIPQAPPGVLALDPTTGQAVDPQTLTPAHGPDDSPQAASQKVADAAFQGLARGGNLAMWHVMGLPLRATVGAGEAAAKGVGQIAGDVAGDLDAGNTAQGNAMQDTLGLPYDMLKGALRSALERPGAPQTYRDLLEEAGVPKGSDAAIAGGAALDLVGDPLNRIHLNQLTAAGEAPTNATAHAIDYLRHGGPGPSQPLSPEWADLAAGGERSAFGLEPTWLARTRRQYGNTIFGNENRSIKELIDALDAQRAADRPIELAPTAADQAAAGQRTAVSFAGHDITPDFVNRAIYGAAGKAADALDAAKDVIPEPVRTTAYKMFGDTTGHPGFDEAERVAQATKTAQEGDYLGGDIARLKGRMEARHGSSPADLDAAKKEVIALATEPTQDIRDLGAKNRQIDNVLEAMSRYGIPVVNLTPEEATAAAKAGKMPAGLPGDSEKYRQLLFDEGPTSARLYAAQNFLEANEGPQAMPQKQADLLKRVLDQMAYYRSPLQQQVNDYWKIAREGHVPDDVLLDPNLASSPDVYDSALEAMKVARKMHEDDLAAGLPASALSGRLGYFPHVADPELLKFAEDIGAKPGMQRGGILEDPSHASMRPRGVRDQTPAEINDPTNLQNDLAQYAGIPLGAYTGPIVSEDPIHALSVRARRSAKAQGAMAYIDGIANLSQAKPGGPVPDGLVDLPDYLQGLGLRVPATTMHRLHGVQIPEGAAPVVASRIAAIYDNPANPTWGQKLADLWDQTQRWWKGKSTLGRGPAYAIGNAADSLVQNYEAGVSDPAYLAPAAQVVYAAHSSPETLLNQVYVPFLDQDIPMQELVRQARKGRALTGGWTAGDPQMPHGGDEPYLGIPALVDAIKSVATGQGGVMNLARRTPFLASLIPGDNLSPTRQASALIAEYADEVPRVAHYLQRLDAGDSFDDAAQSVRNTLYDYGAATDFERNVLKRADLFYTWPRRNIPAQIGYLAQDPGKIASLVKAVHDYEMSQPPPTKQEEFDAQKFEGRFPVWRGRTDYAGPRGPEPNVGQISTLGRYLPPMDLSPFFDTARDVANTAVGPRQINQQGEPMGPLDLAKRMGHQILEGAEPGDQAANPLIDVMNYAGGNNWDKARHRFIDPLAELKERTPQIGQAWPDTPGTFLGGRWGSPGGRYVAQKLNPDLNVLDAWNPGDIFGTHTEPGIFGNTRLSRQDLPAPERDMRFTTGIASYPVGTRLDASMFNQDVRDAMSKYRGAVRQNRAIGVSPEEQLEQRIAFRNAINQLRGLRGRGGEPLTAGDLSP